MKKFYRNLLLILVLSLFCLPSLTGITARPIDDIIPVTISGTVTNTEGAAIVGASLKLYCGGGQIASTTSGSGGYYRMTLGQTYTSCVLQCSYPNYMTADAGVTPSRDRTIDFTLKLKMPAIIEGNNYQNSMYIAHDSSSGIPDEWAIDHSFLVHTTSTIYGQARAFTSVALQPLDYYKTPGGYRSIEFALDIKNFAEVDTFAHGRDGHLLYTNEEAMPPVLTKTVVTMDLYDDHHKNDRMEVFGATSTQLNHRYINIGAPWPDDGNEIDDPNFNYPGCWNIYNPSGGNSLSINYGLLKMVNNNDGKMYVKEKYTSYFNNPERYITAYYEGRRRTSGDSGTTVGLDLKLTLADGRVIWYMPSALRMDQDATTWSEHHIVLDAVATYGSPVQMLQAYCLNYEECTAYMDCVYVGATRWDLSPDPDNPGQTDNYNEWTSQQEANEAFNEKKDQVVMAVGMLGKVLGYIPHPIPQGLSKIIEYGSMVLGICRLPVNYWIATGSGEQDCIIRYPSNGDYRASSGHTTFHFHVDLDNEATGTRSVQLRIKSYYAYGDDYQGLANTFEVENVITLNFLDSYYS